MLFKKVIFIISICASVLFIAACKKEGCTDANADNFDREADKSDNSCTYRYPVAVKVNSLPAAKPNGESWDAADGADVYVRFTKSTGDSWLYTTTTDEDYNGAVTFTIANAANYFTNEQWKFEIKDADLLSEDELMASGTFNPVEGGINGEIPVNNNSVSLIFQYSLKK